MNKKELRLFKKAILKNTHWIGVEQTKKGPIEVGVSGDFEVRKGHDYIEVRDKVSVYRFSR